MKVQSTASPLPPVPTSSSECESSSESESLSESSQLDVNEAWGNNIHFIENDKDFAEKSDESKARKAAESREFARTYELSIQYQHHLIKRFKRLLTMGGDNEEDVKNGEQAENKMEEANEEKELEDEKDENKYNELSILSPPSIAYNVKICFFLNSEKIKLNTYKNKYDFRVYEMMIVIMVWILDN